MLELGERGEIRGLIVVQVEVIQVLELRKGDYVGDLVLSQLK